MTYFSFLFYFLVIPIFILGIITIIDHRRGASLPATLQAWPPWAAILLHVVIALLYTTLWDNYLVATRVWKAEVFPASQLATAIPGALQ